MELLPLLLACSLLFTVAAPARDITSVCASQISDFPQLNSSGLHLTLHHPQSPCSPAPLLSDLPFSTVLTHDDARVAHLASRLATNNETPPRRPTSLRKKAAPATGTGGHLDDSLASVPLSPGMSIGVGNYVTQLGLGTPATSYAMVVDTGSSLTWLQCSPCVVSCHRQAGPLYDPRASSSYASVPCSASQCDELQTATLNPSACSVSNVCIYQASYGDSSFSVGYLSKDTVSFGSSSFPNFYYGCGQDNEGLFGRSAGLIGLARNKLSLFYQLVPSLGYSFSYCLPTSASTGYLSIGSYNPGKHSYTPMASSSLDASLYFVTLSGMSVGGSPLAVSPSEYTSVPTIIDSGTVITRLPTSVYTALSKAVAAAMSGMARAPAFSILDTCFQGQASQLRVPAVVMVFAGGASLKLATRNVLIDVDDSTTCLAFAPTDSTAIIGNTQQQTFSVVYDVAQSRIGFAAGGCS
ncbi:Aspartyl protease family protein [Dichanthelium oligosanthes]|uniref:Aspartyl protease family protein n=1 Tax=Dichanthelium oligosanthes TaxID=888268 RepID=A0A1E5V1Y0_9POAL|nr:Aspartyl protease family protein [Dichanthelium oligosanthes]